MRLYYTFRKGHNLKKYINAFKPFEHIPSKGGGMSNYLRGNIACKDKNSSTDSNGFSNASSIDRSFICIIQRT